MAGSRTLPGRWLVFACAVALAGCASGPPLATPLPTEAERAAARRAGFELGPVRDARELVPAELIEGPHHRVDDRVSNVGGENRYAITSDFGAFEAHGDDQLRARIREIEALAALESMSETAEFAKAAGLALASPFVATWNLITNPVESIRGVPGGAWDAIRNTAQLAQGERSEYEDSGLVAFIGFEAKKREIAAELDVDPYSSNPRLQKQLNRFAWAAYAGSLPRMFVPFTEDAPLPQREERIEGLLVEYSPEDLGRLNRIELAVMGVGSELADAFIGHRWYSPRHETLLVEALSGLDLAADRSAFIEVAVTAQSESEALGHLRVARLLREYNDEVAPIHRIVAVDRQLMGHTEAHTLVVPLPADHALWTPSTAALCESARGAIDDTLEVDATALVVSGSASALTRERTRALGIEVTEHALRAFARPNTGGAAAE